MFSKTPPTAPTIAKQTVRRTVHGQELIDDYAWLRADNWQEILTDPDKTPSDIRAMLEAENAYAQEVLSPMRETREKIVAELRARMKEDDAQAPLPDGPFEYFWKYRPGGQYQIFCRIYSATREENVLLDGDAEAKDRSYFRVGAVVHSRDHRWVAWSCDDAGSELYSIRVRDAYTGVDLPDCVTHTDGSIVWSRQCDAFYYVRVDANHRTSQVFRHRLGEAQDQNQLIIEELDPAWFVHLHETLSADFAVVAITDHDSSECWLIDLADPAAAPRRIAPRARKIRYEVDHNGDQLFIRANADGAEDFKICVAPIATPGRENWRDVVAHKSGRLIIAMAVYRRFMARLERENGLSRIVVRDLSSGAEHDIAFDEEAYSLRLIEGLEFDTDIVRFGYSSMTTPEEIYDYDMAARRRILRKREQIPSGHDPEHYVARRIFARTQDGEDVPISLLMRKDLTGPAPCLLYAYGAYGYATPASFSPNRFSLVDRGFVYAIAHVRGGTDKGWRWYENGKLQHKPNTFADFIACANKLIADGFTAKGKIVAHGGSAGGMLMGAIANQAPNLFAGVIADVPFVDVVNTMLDADLPLTPPEWLEWGDPITDAQAFKTILSYSPYDNVVAQDYPPILAFGGLTDPRVTYWEPAKWIARLRERMTGGGPVMLITNMDAGHGGPSGRFHQLEEVATEQVFALAATS